MEEQIQPVISNLWDRYKTHPQHSRLLIGVSGIPGSGKTSLAKHIVKSLNKLASEETSKSTDSAPAIDLSMDGYHLSRAQLDALPNPEEAHRRRGAAFTFDADGFARLIRVLKEDIKDGEVIKAPSFSHALKDPVADDILILPQHRIVVIEGNYVALDVEPWREAGALFDVIIFVDVDEDVAKARLVKRHVEAGIVKDEEEALERAEGSDLVNGREILAKRFTERSVQVEKVYSREDKGWVDDVS